MFNILLSLQGQKFIFLDTRWYDRTSAFIVQFPIYYWESQNEGECNFVFVKFKQGFQILPNKIWQKDKSVRKEKSYISKIDLQFFSAKYLIYFSNIMELLT